MPPKVKATQVHTIPPGSDAAPGEVIEYIYDAATDLGDGQAPQNPTAELLALPGRTPVVGGATIDTPAIDGTRIFVRVTGIERGKQYELRIGFEHTSPRVAGEKSVKLHIIEGI